MDDQQLVSIIIPVYNVEKYIVENIKKVLGQTYENIEVIYVCDGCSDDSYALLMKYTCNNPRVKVINREINLGAARTRNEGARESAGEWLIFWDADDIPTIDAIEVMLNTAVENNADMVISAYPQKDMHAVDVYPRLFHTLRSHVSSYPIYEGSKDINDLAELIVNNGPVNKLISRKIYDLEKVYFQDLKNCNDVYYSVSSFLMAKRVAYIDKYTYFYRVEAANNITSKRTTVKSYILEALEEVRKLLADLGYSEKTFRNFAYVKIMGYYGEPVFNQILEEYNERYKELWKLNLERKTLFCFGQSEILNGKRVVIYGSGRVGRDYRMSLSDQIEFLGFFDSNPKQEDVKHVECINDINFDYVIIATESDIYAEQMEARLVSSGIERSKIIDTYPCYYLPE